MTQYPHRAYGVDELLRALKLLSPKDLPKQAVAAEQITVALTALHQEGFCRDITPTLFKTRLFLDKEKQIEHVFIGGMGNALYRFSATVFRLNIGVLSLFFVRNEKAKSWRVSVFDATIGKNYSLVRFLGDGTHIFGTDPKVADGESGWVIDGKYIEKSHVTFRISGNQIEMADHRTLRGTRVDHLTDSGFEAYSESANQFLASTDAVGQADSIKRGRFVLEQFIKHHKNYEMIFFSAVLDAISLKK